ncbi:MAG: hypothetical protein ACRC2V_16275 [Xenococcaceae cyanobacterium]
MEKAKFYAQIFVSLSVLFFCMAKLNDAKGEELALYWGGITGIVGYWLPSPTDK